jgi:hypothetical protein
MARKAREPRSVEIRSYQVGFGDCFLLSFVYGDEDKRHVLIDFGTMALPQGRSKSAPKPSDHMPNVARHIARTCEGKLTAVVATHRHADHISGFGTDARTGGSGKVIRELRPKVVIQPWTEDPDAATDAEGATADSPRSRKSFVAGLLRMQALAGDVAKLAAKPHSWMSASLRKELSFIAGDNLRNRSAVENLIAMGRAPGARAVWARHGSSAGLGALLPGVKVHVLGPPDLTQTETIRTMRRTDPDEFWHLLQAAPIEAAAGRAASGGRRAADGARRVPSEARWFEQRLRRLRGEQLLQIVRTLDDQMNNTSLILLFEVLGKKLLFPGDAQLENWSYALQDAPDAAATRRLLAGVDLYKVGHHGSLNATPKTMLWGGFKKRNGNGRGRLHALLSTMPGKHGKAQSRTEVPRRTLVEALEEETELRSTEGLKFGKEPELCWPLVVTKSALRFGEAER